MRISSVLFGLLLVSCVVCTSFDITIRAGQPGRCSVLSTNHISSHVLPVTNAGVIHLRDLPEGRTYVHVSCGTDVFPVFVASVADSVTLSRQLSSGKLKPVDHTVLQRPTVNYKSLSFTPAPQPTLLEKIQSNKKMFIIGGGMLVMLVMSKVTKNVVPTVVETQPARGSTDLSIKDILDAEGKPAGPMAQVKEMFAQQKALIDAQEQKKAA